MTHLFGPVDDAEVTFAHCAWMSPMMQFAELPDGDGTGTATD